jgi:NTP pyrophosphatase (non-canonical NTP hydrolase)
VITAEALKKMETDVEQYCRDKGWYDNEVPFAVAMALLHEEAAEAGHAWRDHGLEDATKLTFSDHGFTTRIDNPKPEGVGSEFADILIRMLDDTVRYDMDLAGHLEPDPEIFELNGEFLVNINALHGLIADVTRAQDTCYQDPCAAFAAILTFLLQLCERCGIDLMAEYERKMAYNRTRAYRHGGRRF